MGMRKNLRDIYKLFLYDEELLRLLHYKPEDMVSGRPEPIDDSLTNINDLPLDEQWTIRDECIKLVPKSDDLVEKEICRIYLYAGRRRPTRNYHVASQEVVVDILCHEDYEVDQRSAWIGDRINELLIQEHVTGLGEIDYVDGNQISCPSGYVAYQHVYKFGSTKR
jgi:hypothetical protein